MLTNSDKGKTKVCLSSIFNLPLSLLFISVTDPFPNLDPDPQVSGPPGSGSIVRGMDPDLDPSITLLSSSKNSKKNLDSYPFCDFFWTFYL